MSIVIDANVTIAWLVEKAPSAISKAALNALEENGAVVPALWRWEVQEVLRRYEERGALSKSAAFVLRELRELPIVVDDELTGIFGDELSIATTYGLSVYDAAYLEVALRHQFALATNDKQLAAAAKRAGVAFRP